MDSRKFPDSSQGLRLAGEYSVGSPSYFLSGPVEKALKFLFMFGCRMRWKVLLLSVL